MARKQRNPYSEVNIPDTAGSTSSDMNDLRALEELGGATKEEALAHSRHNRRIQGVLVGVVAVVLCGWLSAVIFYLFYAVGKEVGYAPYVVQGTGTATLALAFVTVALSITKGTR